MSKIKIGVDNIADLTEEMYKKYNLEVIYFGVVIGSEVYRDTEVKPEDIYKAVEEDGLLPKTNAALEIDYRELFERATADGGSIIHFNISDKLSASHQNALRAARGLDRVYVIDTKSASAGTGLLAIKASELVQQGKSVEEILAVISKMIVQLNVGFIIKDLNYLYRGGRASLLKLFGANLLKIRPSLFIDKNGKIVPGKKFKGEYASAVREWTKFRIEESHSANKDVAIVVYTDIDEKIIEETVESLRNTGFKQIMRIQLGTTLTIHVGRNTIGVIFLG